LPYETTAKGPRRGLPEVVAVGPGRVEVHGPVVRVGELVVGEVVVVPQPGKLQVGEPAIDAEMRPFAIPDEARERPWDNLHRRPLAGRGPESLGRIAVRARQRTLTGDKNSGGRTGVAGILERRPDRRSRLADRGRRPGGRNHGRQQGGTDHGRLMQLEVHHRPPPMFTVACLTAAYTTANPPKRKLVVLTGNASGRWNPVHLSAIRK